MVWSGDDGEVELPEGGGLLNPSRFLQSFSQSVSESVCQLKSCLFIYLFYDWPAHDLAYWYKTKALNECKQLEPFSCVTDFNSFSFWSRRWIFDDTTDLKNMYFAWDRQDVSQQVGCMGGHQGGLGGGRWGDCSSSDIEQTNKQTNKQPTSSRSRV